MDTQRAGNVRPVVKRPSQIGKVISWRPLTAPGCHHGARTRPGTPQALGNKLAYMGRQLDDITNGA